MHDQKDLEASWTRTRAYLQAAFRELPASLAKGEEGQTTQQYFEWLEHNELELALDELEGLGETNPVPISFWRALLDAATNMNLGEHAERYRQRAGI